MAEVDERPAPSVPIGPTEHLNTVEYWRDLYVEAIHLGQEMLDQERAETERLRAAIRLHRDSREVGTFFDQRLWSVLGQGDHASE